MQFKPINFVLFLLSACITVLVFLIAAKSLVSGLLLAVGILLIVLAGLLPESDNDDGDVFLFVIGFIITIYVVVTQL